LLLFNPHDAMTAFQAHRVAVELERVRAHVADGTLVFLEEVIFPMRGENDEILLISEILQVSPAKTLSTPPLLLGRSNAVFREELLIYRLRSLTVRNP